MNEDENLTPAADPAPEEASVTENAVPAEEPAAAETPAPEAAPAETPAGPADEAAPAAEPVSEAKPSDPNDGWYTAPASAAPAAPKATDHRTRTTLLVIAGAILLCGIACFCFHRCVSHIKDLMNFHVTAVIPGNITDDPFDYGSGSDSGSSEDHDSDYESPYDYYGFDFGDFSDYFGDDFGAFLPGTSDGDEEDKGDSGDYQDWMDSYFTDSTTDTEPCDIPRTEAEDGVELPVTDEAGEELSLQDLYEQCAPSIVAIRTYPDAEDDGSYYWGTGVIFTSDGYIVTNSHVVEGTERATVTVNDDENQVYEAYLVGNDARSDIAVLKIDAEDLTPAEFYTGSCRVGDSVVAIGNPLSDTFSRSMTEGIISGIDRDINYDGTTMTLLQTTAPINGGNSGGALFNMSGQVIGITNMKMSSSMYSSGASIEGIGFAIPSATAQKMVNSILANGEVLGRPALGLTLGTVPSYAQTTYGLPSGLYISAIAPGSDCENADIQVGDVLVSFNGVDVTSVDEVSALMTEPGDTVEMVIWRQTESGGETHTVTVTLVDVNDIY